MQRACQLTRFRVRTLLVLVTAIAIWMAWYAERARNQQAAVTAIRNAGANIFYSFEMAEDVPHIDYASSSLITLRRLDAGQLLVEALVAVR